MKLVKINDVYHVRFKTASGRTATKTTRCANKEEALRVVKEAGIADLEAAAKAGRLSRDVIGHIITGKKMTMAKALEKHEQSMLRRRAAKTAANAAAVLNAWATQMNLMHLPPSAVSEEHVDKWINNPDAPAKAQTRRVNLSIIRTFFDFCIEHGWCYANPAGRHRVGVNMNLLSLEQKEVKKVLPFTPHEVKTLLSYLKREGAPIFWRFAVLASYELGLRLGDICQLEWACFRPNGEIVVWTDKRDKRVALKISDALAELSTEIPVTDHQYLFPEQRKMHLDPTRRAILSVYFSRICEKAGITGKSFHSLRHARITEWAKQGKSLEQIARDVGHSSIETTKGYVH